MASDILKTFGILLKIEGKAEAQKVIDDLEKRLSRATKHSTQQLKELRETLRFRREEAALQAQQFKNEALSHKAKDASIKQQYSAWKFELSKEKEKARIAREIEKQKEKRLKEEEKARNKEDAQRRREEASRRARKQAIYNAILTGSVGGVVGGLVGGGIAGLLELAKSAIQTVAGWSIEAGKSGAALKYASRGLNPAEAKELSKIVSNLERLSVQMGGSFGGMASWVANLADSLTKAHTEGNSALFNALAMAGGFVKWRGEYPDLLFTLKGLISGKDKNLLGRASALSTLTDGNIAAQYAFENYREYSGNLYDVYEKNITAMGALQSAFLEVKTAITNAFSATLSDSLKALANWVQSKEAQERIMSLVNELSNVGKLLYKVMQEYLVPLLTWLVGKPNKSVPANENLKTMNVGGGAGALEFPNPNAPSLWEQMNALLDMLTKRFPNAGVRDFNRSQVMWTTPPLSLNAPITINVNGAVSPQATAYAIGDRLTSIFNTLNT